jgi:hypothetical protein
MNVESKLTINLNVGDVERVMSAAIVAMLKDDYGMVITDSDILKIRFNTTINYGPMDRGPGTPALAGVTVEIKQPTKGVK